MNYLLLILDITLIAKARTSGFLSDNSFFKKKKNKKELKKKIKNKNKIK